MYSIIDTTSKYCNALAITDALHTLQSNIRMIEIDTYMVKATDFTISDKTKNFLVKQGEHAVSDYINKLWLERLMTENKLQRYIQKELYEPSNNTLEPSDNSFTENITINEEPSSMVVEENASNRSETSNTNDTILEVKRSDYSTIKDAIVPVLKMIGIVTLFKASIAHFLSPLNRPMNLPLNTPFTCKEQVWL